MLSQGTIRFRSRTVRETAAETIPGMQVNGIAFTIPDAPLRI